MNDRAPLPEGTVPARIRGTGYTAEAGWFGPEERPRFGWLYRPDNPAPNGVGVVIVPPFGYEAICAHRTLKHLAEDIAGAGFMALRFDLDGTGDSAGDDTDADRMDAWRASIGDACDLVRRTGAAQLVLVGVRLGAALAMLSAQGREDVRALVAFNAVVSGKAYLRELRVLQNAMNLAPPPTPFEEGGQETNGFLLNAQACEALKTLDLTTMAAPAADLWLLERDDMPERLGAWLGALRTAGRQAVHRRIAGYVKMVDAAHSNHVAQDFIGACIECARSIRENPGSISPAKSCALRSSIELHAEDSTTVEEVIAPGMGMFGILARPATRGSGRTLLILNAGAIRHIGSNRMSVSLARRLAAAGQEVLRADFTGIGDSPARDGEPENIVYGPHGVADAGILVEWLRKRGARDITVGGMCSGAYHAFRGALALQAINRIYMINCAVFGAHVDFDPESASLFGDIAHYNQSMRSRQAWRRLLTGKAALGTVFRVAAWHAKHRGGRLARDLARRLHLPLHDDLGSHLLALARRGTHVHFLYSEADPGRAVLANAAGSVTTRLHRQGHCDIQIFQGADHTFTQRWAQHSLSEALERMLSANMDRTC
jgi:pimeloyl-ACP methyl ester carboxylesterase